MNYQEFRKTYSATLKKYPLIDQFFRDDIRAPHEFICVTTKYTRCGKQWKQTESRTETVTNQNYINSIDAVPFFRGMGFSERVKCGYTSFGFLPYSVSSTYPDGMSKTERVFYF